MHKDSLELAISDAFHDVPYPGDDCLVDPGGRDDEENVVEGCAGLDWRDIDWVESWPMGIWFMSPEAQHFYLPAWMLASIADEAGESDCATLSLLEPDSVEGLTMGWSRDHERNLLFLLSPAQKQVIRVFLSYLLKQITDPVPRTERPDEFAIVTPTPSKLLEFWRQA